MSGLKGVSQGFRICFGAKGLGSRFGEYRASV